MNTLMSYWLGIMFFLFVLIGFFVDILLVSVYWEKLVNLFKRATKIIPWGFRDLLRICLGLILINVFIHLAGYVILKLSPIKTEQFKRILGITSSLGVYGLGLWYVVNYLRNSYPRGLKVLGIKLFLWQRNSLKGLLLYLGFFPIMMVLTYIGILFCYFLGTQPEPHPLVDMLKEEKSFWFISFSLILAAFIGPILEEILFRGLFYQVLKKRFGLLKAMILSSCLFSLLHFNSAQFLPIMGLGMLLCFIFEYSGSLIPAMAVHIFNNGLFLGLFFLLRNYI